MGLFELFKKKDSPSVVEKYIPTDNKTENNVQPFKTASCNNIQEESFLEKRVKFIKTKENEFINTLNNLEKAEIEISAFTKLNNGEYEVKFSNITSKSKKELLQDFVVIDVETTGLKSTSGIVELSAIKFVSFSPVAVFSTLVKPPRRIPEEATAVNGITNELVANSPKIDDVANSFLNFVGDYNIVGHNLEYDLNILEHKGIVFGKRKYFDTLELVKKVLKKTKHKHSSYSNKCEMDYDIENYKLETLCDYYSIFRPVSHRADSDCLATGYIFKKIVDEII